MVQLNLSEALTGVSHRQQTVLVDKIYSFLGLLPYGHLVAAEYRAKNCSCENNCHHDPHTPQDLAAALTRVEQARIKYQQIKQIFLVNGDYQMSANGCLIPQLVQATADSVANYHFVGKILETELKEYGYIESLTLTINGPALAVNGRKLIIKKIFKHGDIYYEVKAPGYEFGIDKDENYCPYVDDSFIVTDQGIDFEYKSLLIKSNQVKVFTIANLSAKLIEYQTLILTYHNKQINIKVEPDLTAQINCKEQFLAAIKAELKLFGKDLDQPLLTQFYITPNATKLAVVIDSCL
jgi:hypothetical protein